MAETQSAVDESAAKCSAGAAVSATPRRPSYTWVIIPRSPVYRMRPLHAPAGRGIEDTLQPSPAARARDALWAIRSVIVARRWHGRPVIGGVLRWLGARLP
ncbi:hypothetical protein [Blastococcus sp. CT_GayMR16]|uniref:hypothetical protein n=1 Tax=Blastococcus sp. CT_GayMR16 TaxID=2559607 RepID=UPI0010738914|nr:hypothetical protein [Blastococcus sp. CT_GayMR16]